MPRVESNRPYGNSVFYVVNGQRYHTLNSSAGFVERGLASWYGKKFHGRRTSSGEPYDMYAMTAAHRSLPLPTYVQVTNLKNGRTVVVRINDRGPFHGKRIIDLSYAAASKLGIVREGTGLVEIRALDPQDAMPSEAQVPVATPQMFIQVGAFSIRRNAERLRNGLNGHDLGAIRIVAGTHEKGEIYRVRIGPLVSVALAERAAKRLDELGLRHYRLVIDHAKGVRSATHRTGVQNSNAERCC